MRVLTQPPEAPEAPDNPSMVAGPAEKGSIWLEKAATAEVLVSYSDSIRLALDLVCSQLASSSSSSQYNCLFSYLSHLQPWTGYKCLII